MTLPDEYSNDADVSQNAHKASQYYRNLGMSLDEGAGAGGAGPLAIFGREASKEEEVDVDLRARLHIGAGDPDAEDKVRSSVPSKKPHPLKELQQQQQVDALPPGGRKKRKKKKKKAATAVADPGAGAVANLGAGGVAIREEKEEGMAGAGKGEGRITTAMMLELAGMLRKEAEFDSEEEVMSPEEERLALAQFDNLELKLSKLGISLKTKEGRRGGGEGGGGAGDGKGEGSEDNPPLTGFASFLRESQFSPQERKMLEVMESRFYEVASKLPESWRKSKTSPTTTAAAVEASGPEKGAESDGKGAGLGSGVSMGEAKDSTRLERDREEVDEIGITLPEQYKFPESSSPARAAGRSSGSESTGSEVDGDSQEEEGEGEGGATAAKAWYSVLKEEGLAAPTSSEDAVGM